MNSSFQACSINTRPVSQIAVGQARFEAHNFTKLTMFWVFVVPTKINLEVKIDLSASFWRDSFSGPKQTKHYA